ncbi:hypothetical protein PGT21_028475 [Puccinia graminis f. sp. tritici]|uniref:Uncharacterized protein n=1 Tax=Puccinia graminis f. sp. tritici TaxID=56615 RepID=A0A5B0PAQ3_PUCGR|nr:hypothetical protein PGT21_028475 [Puccinia graminis f. sp. tritici]
MGQTAQVPAYRPACARWLTAVMIVNVKIDKGARETRLLTWNDALRDLQNTASSLVEASISAVGLLSAASLLVLLPSSPLVDHSAQYSWECQATLT